MASTRARPVNLRTEMNVLAILLQAKQSYNVIRRMLIDQGSALEFFFDRIEEQECHLMNCKEDLTKIRGHIDKLIEKCTKTPAANRWCKKSKKMFNCVFSEWVAAWEELHQAKKEIAIADETEKKNGANKKAEEETLSNNINDMIDFTLSCLSL